MNFIHCYSICTKTVWQLALRRLQIHHERAAEPEAGHGLLQTGLLLLGRPLGGQAVDAAAGVLQQQLHILPSIRWLSLAPFLRLPLVEAEYLAAQKAVAQALADHAAAGSVREIVVIIMALCKQDR